MKFSFFLFLKGIQNYKQINKKVNVYVEWKKKSQEVAESLEIPASVFWQHPRQFREIFVKNGSCLPLSIHAQYLQEPVSVSGPEASSSSASL